jgi:hypothetical protein
LVFIRARSRYLSDRSVSCVDALCVEVVSDVADGVGASSHSETEATSYRSVLVSHIHGNSLVTFTSVSLLLPFGSLQCLQVQGCIHWGAPDDPAWSSWGIISRFSLSLRCVSSPISLSMTWADFLSQS